MKYKLESKEGPLAWKGCVSYWVSFILKGPQEDPSVPGGLPEDPEAEVIIGKAMDHLVLIES